jgi:hypothetical protein
MQSLTSGIVGKIATALGLDRSTVQKAVDAAVPAILAAFAGVATKPGGARKISEAISTEGTSVLNNLGRTLEGSGYRALTEHGSDLLNSMLGGSTTAGLTSAISKFAKLDERTSSSLIGLLGPVVAGTLRRQQEESGLDTAGLASLLTSQKDNLAAALPSGFASLLGGTDILDDLGERAASVKKAAVSREYRTSKEGPSLNWLAWAIPLIALLALGWYFLNQQSSKSVPSTTAATQTSTTEQTGTNTQATTSSTTQSAATVTDLTIDGVDLGASVTAAIDDLKASLQGITDKATAEAALPKLQETTTALDEVSIKADKLSAEQKTGVASLVTAALPIVNPLFDSVLAIPGVSEIAKPAIDGLRMKLDQLANA